MAGHKWGRTVALPVMASAVIAAGAGAAVTQGAPARRGTVIAVGAGAPWEFGLKMRTQVVRAGKVSFRVTNRGKLVHELIVMRTRTRAAELSPISRDGQVVEVGVRGEVEDIDPGTTKTLTLRLPRGHYVLICNEPGHYLSGMHRDLIVK